MRFSLIPVDPGKTLNPYVLKYNTGICYSTNISKSTITNRLLFARFTFSYNNQDYLYKVAGNTIKEMQTSYKKLVLHLVKKVFCFKNHSINYKKHL